MDWIGPFIEVELASVIAWCNKNKHAQNASDIFGSRFDDDGSNFRSTVKSSILPWEPLAQISQVISCKNPKIIVITDGYTQIKAKLSDSAVHTLESEIEEKIDLGMKGDVFAIKETIVASTPYGPADEHIQLDIQEIEYKYHLRKTLGQSIPILERSEAGRLLTEITEIRRQQYEVPEDHAEPESTRANAHANAVAIAGASRPSGQSLTNESHSPQSQHSQSRSSPAAFTRLSSGTQRAVATQIPINRKRKAPPTLEEDGFEIKQGYNLARPHGPGFKQPTTRPLPGKRRHFETDQTGAKLLGLLKKQASDMQQPPPPGPPIDLTSQSSHESLHSSPHAPTTVPDISGGVEQMSIEATGQMPELTSGQSVQGDKSQLLPAPPKYSLRRIPIDQRKLLEKQDSWVPSLPGKQLPHPNIPIQLLGQWHDRTSPDDKDPEDEDDANIGSDAVEAAMDTSESSSESSEEEELEWEATPSQKRPQLPPDSTMGSGINTSPLANRIQRPSSSSQYSSHARQQLPSDSSNGSANRSSPVLKQTQRSFDSSPSSAVNKPQTSAYASSVGSGTHRQPMRSQYLAAKRQKVPDTSKLGTGPRNSQVKNSALRSINGSNQNPRPSSSGSIVKGTRLSGGDEMDIEMSVPRSLEEKDPIETTRQKRRDALKPGQREKW
jgi:hypothetical protein